MKVVNIDLGESYENYPSPQTASEPEGKRYPSFFIETDEDLDLPKEGEMTISFKRTSETHSESDPGGERYCCTIQVNKIVAVDGKETSTPSKKYDEAGDALDAIMNALKNKSED